MQQRACANLGSAFYETLLDVLSNDYANGGVTHTLLAGVSDRPIHDALPLRLLGGLHAIALSGVDSALSSQYPSAGGTPNQDVGRIVLEALRHHEVELSQAVRRNVQTNEVGRSVVALSILRWLPTIGGLSCRWFEVGASAGLNLNFPLFYASTGTTVMGEATSTVFFGPEWFTSSPPAGESSVCIERRGCDPFPIDVSNEEQRRRLLGFVWPDQTERRERLRRAIEIARQHPPRVDRADGGEWLASFDASPTREHEATVVYHSIVWQYMSPDSRREFTGQLDRIGAQSTHDRPLVWARMEPAGDTADIQATVWRGDDSPLHFHLGHVGYHGQNLRWSPRPVVT